MASADPEGEGPGVRTPPLPRNLSEVGSCVEAWWVGEGVKRLLLPYNYFFSGSLRSPILYKYITCIHTSMFNVQYGTVILSLYFPYPNNFPSLRPCFYGRAFSYLSCLELHNFTLKFLGEEPQPPFPIKTTMSYVCLCREGISVVQKDHAPYRKYTCI